jgi:long-chain acyl-CoA synthetase
MTSPDLSIHNTVPKLFWYNVENYGNDITTWRKQKGVWDSITWRDYGQWVKEIANALLDAGIQKGDKVSILSQTRFEWVAVDLAIMSIGAVTAPVYHSNTEEQVIILLITANQNLFL